MGIFSYSSPLFTDKNLSDQSGKVFIVTGATSARSADKADRTIRKLKEQYPTAKGELVFLCLDLNDLATIKTSADEFLKKETKLNVLWNNAGVMIPPQGSITKQGYEQQLGTNNLAPFLFTKLLTPILKDTAKTEPVGTVRVVWVASSAAANFAPKGGVVMKNLSYKQDQGAWHKYGVSKAGNIFQAAEYARRFGSDNIISVSLDPGNLKTPLYQNTPKWQMPFLNLILKDPIFGAYTELFAGFSPQIQMKNNGQFIKPFGKLGTTRDDIETSRKSKSEGGNGIAEKFYDWNEEQVTPFL